MPTSQADMEQLLKDEKDGGEWNSGRKWLALDDGCLKAYTAGEMQQLCSLIPKAHPDVKVLSMGDNALDDAQAAAVAEALERLPHLKELYLEGNKFGGEAAAKIFIAAVPHCLHLDELFMPKHCDPNTVDCAQLGVTMSPDVLAAAKKTPSGNWQWGAMVKKQREMQAAGLVAPLPTVAAGVDQAKQAEAEPKTKPEAEAEAKKKPDAEATSKAEAQAKPKAEAEAKKAAEEEAKKEAEEASLSELLLGVGVKPNKVDQVLKALEEAGVEDVEDMRQFEDVDVDKLGLPVLQARLVTKLLSNLKMGGAGGAGAGAGGGAGAGAGAGAHPQVGGSGEVPGVPAGKRFHVFLTHDWGEDDKGRNNHVRATRLNEWLKARGVSTWFDSDKMQGNVVQQMCDGIDASAAVLVLVTKRYVDKVGGTNHADNCKKEFMYADRQKTSSQMLPVVMEQRMKDSRQWGGPVGMSLGGQLYQKLWDDSTFDQDAEGVLAGLVKMLLSP